MKAAVILYLAFIWPSARFVPRSNLQSVADRVPSGSARVVVRRAQQRKHASSRGQARLSSKPSAHTGRLQASWYAIAHDCRGTCVTALQVLGVLVQPNQLRPAVVTVLSKGSGSSPQHQSQRAFPWVMSLLARAPRLLSTKPLLPTPTPSSPAPCRSSLPLSLSDALPCRSLLSLTTARRRRIAPHDWTC